MRAEGAARAADATSACRAHLPALPPIGHGTDVVQHPLRGGHASAAPAASPQPAAMPPSDDHRPWQPFFWATPITACVQGAWWGLTRCFSWSLTAAQSLGVWAGAIKELVLGLWPQAPFAPAQAEAAAPRAADAATEQQCAQRTLALLRGVRHDDAPALSQSERAALLRAYYPAAKLIYALRHDAALRDVRQRHAAHVLVPQALLGLQQSALGLDALGVSPPSSSEVVARICLTLKQRMLSRMQQAGVHTAARAPLRAPTIDGVHAWLAQAGVQAPSLQQARRWAGVDVVLAIGADPEHRAHHAAQKAIACFGPHQAFDPSNAADDRARALQLWAEQAPPGGALALLRAACEMSDGPEPLLFDALEPAEARHVVAALTDHGHLRSSVMLTALLAPDAWPRVCCVLEALGFDPTDLHDAWTQARRWALLCAPHRLFVARDVLGPKQLWHGLSHRFAFAALLDAPIDVTVWLDCMRQAQHLGGAQIVEMAAQAGSLVVAAGRSTLDALRHCLLQGAQKGLYDYDTLRQGAHACGLDDARMAAPLVQRVLISEASCAADLTALSAAWVWDPNAAQHADGLLTRLHVQLHKRLVPLDALDAAGAHPVATRGAAVGVRESLHVHTAVVSGVRIDVLPPHAPFADPPATHITLPQEATFAACLRQGRSVLLEGPAGSGKTQMVAAMAMRLGLELHRLTLSPETDEQDLLGRYMPHSTKRPVWSDGLLVRAMRRGDVVLLDEANLAPPGLLERLNSVFDSRRLFVETTGEHIVAHANFRCVLAANPARYAGRSTFGEALRSRLRVIRCPPLTADVLRPMLEQLAQARLPDALLDTLVAAHLGVMAQLAKRHVSSMAERITPRAVTRVLQRVLKLEANLLPGQSLQSLAAREFDEIYAGLVGDDWRDLGRSGREVMGLAQPVDLSDGLVMGGTHLQLGDLRWPRPSAAMPASDLILTARTCQILYRLLKAMLCGEPVALIGRRAGGKTALVTLAASLLGRPFVQQVMSAGSDVGCLIGSYGPEGWRDGALLALSRPGNTPGVLLLDECNLAPSAVLERLNAVLDDARTLTLPEHDGSAIRLHDDFRLVCAMNPSGPQNPGRARLSSALCSRLTWIEVPEIDANEQDAIAEGLARQLNVADAQALCAALRRFVETQLHRVDRTQLSLRELCGAVRTFADLSAQMSVPDAFSLALKAEYGAFLPDVAPSQWAQAARSAWPEAGWPQEAHAE